jgi:dynein assembly factor 5, axonemal
MMMDTNSIDDNSNSIALNQILNKFQQGIKDDNKFKRKNALETIKKELTTFLCSKDDKKVEITSIALKQIFKSVVTMVSDSAEKCREVACQIIVLMLDNNSRIEWSNEMTSSLVMVLNQRLGGKDIIETSEEIRLELYSIIQKMVDFKSKEANRIDGRIIEIHFNDFVVMLINAINDNYHEIKKVGCCCIKLLAVNLKGSCFHQQSESFIKPLSLNITHQHSRVRKEIIDCICDVVMYGNNKSVIDVLPHLAQRLFDQAPMVRQMVIKLVGTWLLDLPDRYSFFYRLIPLLLTGFIDETNEIKELTEALWWDIGIKYEKENDADLKDKLNFDKNDDNIENYPQECKNIFKIYYFFSFLMI